MVKLFANSGQTFAGPQNGPPAIDKTADPPDVNLDRGPKNGPPQTPKPRPLPRLLSQGDELNQQWSPHGEDDALSTVGDGRIDIAFRRTTRSANRASGDAMRKPSPPIDLGPRWSKPVTYGPVCRRRALVEFDDLWRLDKGNMLNDNIIDYYMLYVSVVMGRNCFSPA